MEIRNNSNMSFQARVPQELKTQMLDTALNYGSKAVKQAKRQICDIESWGSPDVILDLKYGTKRDGKLFIDFFPDSFALSKNTLPEGENVALPKKKKSLFGSFMALREQDIVNAESKLPNITSKPQASQMDDFFA